MDAGDIIKVNMFIPRWKKQSLKILKVHTVKDILYSL